MMDQQGHPRKNLQCTFAPSVTFNPSGSRQETRTTLQPHTVLAGSPDPQYSSIFVYFPEFLDIGRAEIAHYSANCARFFWPIEPK